MFLPEVRKSADELNKLLADEFIEFGSSGDVYNKKQIISNLETETELEITATNFELNQLASDVIVVKYLALVKSR